MEQEECLSIRLKNIQVSTFEEVRSSVLKLYTSSVVLPKSTRKKGLVKHLIKLKRIEDYIINNVLGSMKKLPNLSELHPFYRDLISMSCIGDRYNRVIEKIISRERVIIKLSREYSEKIRLSFDEPEARKLLREYVGRVLSVFRRLRNDMKCLKELITELRRMPCIMMNEPKIVVAGVPQVGKSTFVSKVSSAKPEISPFPFTTKEIIVGHLEVNYRRIQVIDTPGILDRPINKLNPIERKAFVALRHLSDSIIFIIDPHEGSYYSLNEQISLLNNILNYFKDVRKRVIVVINKIDLVDETRLNYVKREINNVFNGKILTMSALKGIGVMEVLNEAVKLAELSLTLRHR